MTGDSPYSEIPVGEQFTFVLERVSVQEGRTFSEDAMRQFLDQISLFVATQVGKRWDDTKEPPTALAVTVSCEVR
jgi:hypothetical protein